MTRPKPIAMDKKEWDGYVELEKRHKFDCGTIFTKEKLLKSIKTAFVKNLKKPKASPTKAKKSADMEGQGDDMEGMDGEGMDGDGMEGMDGEGMDGEGMDGEGMDGEGMDGDGMDGMDGEGMDGMDGMDDMDGMEGDNADLD